MGLFFRCECGKRVRVRENQIDDKVKCPACHKLLVVREKVDDFNVSASKLAAEKARPGWPLWLLIVIAIGILLFIFLGIEFLQRELDFDQEEACIKAARPLV